MEEQTRLQASRSGYKGHVTRLFNKIDELVSGEFDDYTTTSLSNAIEQLTKKLEKITKIDDRLLELSKDATELETAVLEAEELHDEISEKIARAKRFIELKNSAKQPSRDSPSVSHEVPPSPQLSVESQQNSDHLDSHQHIQHVSEPTSISDLQLNTSQTHSSTVHVSASVSQLDSVATTIVDHTMSSAPLTNTVFSHSGTSLPPLMHLHPPPLISAASYTYAPSIQQRPVKLSVPDVGSLYTSSVNHLGTLPASVGYQQSATIQQLPLANSYSLPVASSYSLPATNYHSTQQFATSRLPKLSLPTFSGDPLTWQAFWDSFFAAIHSNPSLSGIQKFNYLKAQLQGDAARAIEGLPLSELNYRHSISLLQDRFGQTHKLIDAHMKSLMSMASPTNSLASLRMFYDSIESHIRGLSSLGKAEHSYGDLLVPIIMGKLTPEVRRNLAREHSNTQWILTDLMAALQKEIRVLECGLHDSYNAASKMSTTAAFQVRARDNRSTTSSKKKAPVCAFCKGPHSSHSCESVIDHQKRVDIVKRDNLCFNCLAHHKVSQCQSRFRCKKCKKKHHTTLCNSKPPSTESLSDNVTDSKPQTSSADVAGLLTPISPCFTPKSVTTCLLKTAVAPIIAGHTKTSANILFDEGAQRSFISREMVNELGTSLTSTADISLASFGNASRTHQKLGVVTVEIQTLSGELIPISVLVVPTIAAPIQNVVPLSVSTMPHLQGLKLAHPVTSNNNFTISLLIGTDYYWKFVQDTIIRGDGPTAQESKLGYLLSGPLPHCLSQSAASILLQITSSVTPEEPNLEKFWSVESIGTNAHTSSTDLSFLRTYQQSAITQTPEGVYIARFPWKEDKPYLPSNFNICKKRTIALVNKLKQTPELLSIYDNIIKDQQQRGFIETVSDHDATENTHYLPHRPVKKDSVTTPIRIVYDCSCRGNGNSTSLNDCLTVTPPFLNNLCSILLRFRSHAFALSTDIEKVFLHVQLHSDDRNFTRFIWPSSTDDSFLTYRFAVVPFGSSSSPFMLAAVLDLHLSKVASPVALDMKDNIYVDNILSGCNTEEELLTYYKHSRELMSQANFNLRSWSSNSHQLQAVTAREKTSDPKPTVGLLGLQWNTITDTVSLAPKQLPPTNTSFITKRDVLQTSSQIYDPLGWVTPVTVRAKILLQQVWQTKLTWDEPLPKEITDTWLTILPDLMKLSQFTVPRTYFSTSDTSTFHLYAFADASTKAYGAVVYICRNQETSLVMSKSRVAPIKTITLPKLELMAAVMATRLVQFVVSSLHFQSNDQSNHIHLWTDSQIALHWIYKQHNPKPFISHRVAEIVRAFPANSWSYVPSSDNPADLLTRGISAEQLFSSQLWLHGPSWLQCSQDWPQWTPTNAFLQLAEEEDEHGSTPPATQTSEVVTGIHTVIDITRFSTIDKLVAVTAYVLRYVHNAHTQQPRVIGPLSAVERNAAMKEWISSSQTSSYRVELNYLRKKQNSCPNLVRQLRLYLDEKQLLRCSGRIHNAPVSDATKFPVLLPSKHRLTDLIIEDTHRKLHHGGVAITVTALREVYWIPSIRQRVRSVLRRCVTCAKTSGKAYRTPDPPPLPKIRVGEPRPFAVTGVDFTGALYVKESNGEQKAYICLFTCASTRAIHLEIVTDLSAETFLLAFRRFAGRRSIPSIMLSDNASTYLAAAEELKILFESDVIKEALGRQGVDWQFIPKRAPWYGGFWERLIGLTKQAIRKTLGRTFISLDQLQTVVIEIESMLNDRPLTYVNSDLQDPQPLTPSHLLYGRRIQQVPHPLNDPEELTDPTFVYGTDLRNRVNKLAQLMEHFSSRWKREYLTSLREFYKTSKRSSKQLIRTGDVVIVHEDNKSRLHWRLAVVEDLIKGNDGQVRAAHIRTSNHKTTRPVAKLFPLEVHSEATPEEADQSSTSTESQQSTAATETVRVRTMRAAAARALQRMKEWNGALGPPPENVVND